MCVRYTNSWELNLFLRYSSHYSECFNFVQKTILHLTLHKQNCPYLLSFSEILGSEPDCLTLSLYPYLKISVSLDKSLCHRPATAEVASGAAATDQTLDIADALRLTTANMFLLLLLQTEELVDGGGGGSAHHGSQV